MNNEERQHLLAERAFLQRQLAATPTEAKLTRLSDEARLRNVEARLANLPIDERVPARARLIFDGMPVIRSYGILADFSTKAVSSFTDAVVAMAASLITPLSAMGPIPNRDQNQLLITNTALGSFGFELEEDRKDSLSIDTDESPVAQALERTRALLQSTLGNDDDLADIASETDPRALDKVRGFLKVLVDASAICALHYRNQVVRFRDVGQVKRSLTRLEADNLHEREEQLRGKFLGVLPKLRTFEFELADGGRVIHGKVSSHVAGIEAINEHMLELVDITVMCTQVGSGQPRYMITALPQWSENANA